MSLNIFEPIAEMGHELVMFCQDSAAGYRGIIALHSTALGPAAGGTRFWRYASDEEALRDVLRLARGMTYKNAVAGLNLGGGKAVIIGDNKTAERERIFRAHGRFVERLGGRFITAEDVGTSITDLDYVHLETQHVAGRREDPSPWTARGVLRGIQAAAKYRWGSPDLAGKTIALQGCGQVGYALAKELHAAGAALIVTDVEAERAKRAAREFAATIVEPEEIYSAQAHIFAPCALGAVINDRTLEQLRVEIVAGAANNQLLENRHGDALEARGLLYAPDYVINAGGVISGSVEVLGWEPAQAAAKVNGIYETLLAVFEMARAEKIPTYLAADRLAERRLQTAQTMKRRHQ
jgi:leucine dehydrogenase